MGESERGTVEITTETNMQDALAGIRYLRSLGEFGPVGAIGHSEGGQIVFMLGAADEADFIISMAGPGMRGDSILVEQNRLILTKSGFTSESADNYSRVLSGMLEMKMEGYATDSPEALVDSLITALEAQNMPFGSEANLAAVWETIDNPWMLYFLQATPVQDISRTTCPVFALNGSLDLQVPPANLEHIRRHLPDGPLNKSSRNTPASTTCSSPAQQACQQNTAASRSLSPRKCWTTSPDGYSHSYANDGNCYLGNLETMARHWGSFLRSGRPGTVRVMY